MLGLLIIGLLAPKYIGLEGVLTLQLIFYSQLLVYDIRAWPVGFSVFNYFRYANGYNFGVV